MIKVSTPSAHKALHENCLGVVLAGGLSSRMGQDKSTMLRNETSMLDYSKQLLTKASIQNIVVSGNGYDVPDEFTNLGPLSGIYSVIKAYQPKALLVLPVDLPLMQSEALQQLKQLGELKQSATYFSDNFLPLYLPVTAHIELFFQQHFANLSHLKSTKGPSMKGLLKQIPSQAITPNNSNILLNTNTPQEWQHAQSQFLRRN